MNQVFYITIALVNVLSIPAAGTEKPNIVLLFADDAGYGDFGFHGSHHFQTPQLDRLAQSGVLLSHFYVTGATCGPSRAGLLTGRYQQRFGFEENNVPGIMTPSSKLLADDMGLPLDQKTMGNYLQQLGYRTAVFGKWHMGVADRYHPLKRGFDEFYGFRGGARSFFAYPNPRNEKRDNLMERGFEGYQEHEGYLTHVLADEACAFIERNRNRPFFAYVSFNAVHAPMHTDPQDKNAFPQLEGTRRKAAQMMLSLDRACGQIVTRLKALGLADNTLVVFTNDNGGPMDRNGSSNYPFAGVKATQLEGGIRVPGIVSWPGKLPAGTVYDRPLSTLDLIPTFVKAGGGDPAALAGLDGVDMMPNLTAYNETCANICNAMFSYRLLGIHGKAMYADIMERVLYNSALSGISADGKHYFYTNPLRRTHDHAMDTTDQKTREPYIPCFCCPPNLVRTIAKVNNWAYSLAANGIAVSLYGGNELDTKMLDG